MTTTETRSLREAIDQLRADTATLVDPTARPVMRDDGTITTHPAPSLLDELRSELGNGSDRRPGSGSRAGVPIAVDVHDLLTDIDTTTRQMQAALASPGEDTGDRIRGITATVTATTDPDLIGSVADHLAHWIHAARHILDPPRRLHVAAACPACDTRMVSSTDSTGETVQTPALYVDGQTGCHCWACGHHWPTTHLEHLAAVLGCTPLE